MDQTRVVTGQIGQVAEGTALVNVEVGREALWKGNVAYLLQGGKIRFADGVFPKADGGREFQAIPGAEDLRRAAESFVTGYLRATVGELRVVRADPEGGATFLVEVTASPHLASSHFLVTAKPMASSLRFIAEVAKE